jgi:hypothetical protein
MLMHSHAITHRRAAAGGSGGAHARLVHGRSSWQGRKLATWRRWGCYCNRPFSMGARWTALRFGSLGGAGDLRHHPATHDPPLLLPLAGPLAPSALAREQLARARIQSVPTAIRTLYCPYVGLPAAQCLLVRPPACCQPGVAGLAERGDLHHSLIQSYCNHLLRFSDVASCGGATV